MIPPKSWAHLLDTMTDYILGTVELPVLTAEEEQCNFPFSASPEQLEEWQAVCRRAGRAGGHARRI